MPDPDNLYYEIYREVRTAWLARLLRIEVQRRNSLRQQIEMMEDGRLGTHGVAPESRTQIDTTQQSLAEARRQLEDVDRRLAEIFGEVTIVS